MFGLERINHLSEKEKHEVYIFIGIELLCEYDHEKALRNIESYIDGILWKEISDKIKERSEEKYKRHREEYNKKMNGAE